MKEKDGLRDADVVLIEPADHRKGDWRLMPVLGLAYLAAALEERGWRPAIIDTAFEPGGCAGIMRRLRSTRARIFALTAPTPEIGNAHRLALEMKREFPGCTVIVGGPHVTFLPVETLLEFGAFDIVVMGEGERTLQELMDALTRKTGLSLIKGIAYRENGEIRLNPQRERVADLDSLPFPAWHLYPARKPRREFPVASSRGCPFRCKFCVKIVDAAKFRTPANVVEELEWLIGEYGARYVSFEDDNLFFRDERTHALLDLLIRKGIGRRLKWYAQSRADMMDRELLKKAKAAGCEYLFFGAESGSSRIIEMTGKGITREKSEEIVRICRELGIKVGVTFILGHPDESVGTVRETIDFAARLNPDRAEFQVMTPYPGTRIADFARENSHGYRLLSTDWSVYDHPNIGSMEFTAIGNRRMKLLHAQAYLTFYLRNRRFLELLVMLWKRKGSYARQLARLMRQ